MEVKLNRIEQIGVKIGHYVYSCHRFSSGNPLEDYNP
jgi:hypothetical protein